MSYFQSLKDSVTCWDAAEQYGMEVNTTGMARCPFHEDRHPSLKLGRGFHCFGCGAHGDLISFVSRLFGISAGDAAQKLSRDFGIPVHLRGPPVVSMPDSTSDLEQVGYICKRGSTSLLRFAGDVEAGTAAHFTGRILAPAVCGSFAAAGRHPGTDPYSGVQQ